MAVPMESHPPVPVLCKSGVLLCSSPDQTHKAPMYPIFLGLMDFPPLFPQWTFRYLGLVRFIAVFPHTCTSVHHRIPFSLVVSFPPPPFVLPHPLSFSLLAGGGGGGHLISTKFLVTAHGTLCCCVGDCDCDCEALPLVSLVLLVGHFAHFR